MNFSNMSIRNKLLLGNGITTILLILLCGIVWSSINTLNSTSKMVTHTYEVIDNSNGLVTSMVDQETGLRGFAVGGQDDYLEPYIEGKEKFSKYLKTAKQLTSDNPTQQKRFDDVASDAANWQAYAEKMIDLRKDIRKGEEKNRKLHVLINSGIGKQQMDGLRNEISSGQFKKSGENILAGMVNMETGLRGFMLNREEGYLEPYISGKNSVLSVLNTIEGTILAINARSWINNYAEKAIALVRETSKFKDNQELYLEFSKKQGKQYMDGLRKKVSTITMEEQRLMGERQKAASDSSSLAVSVIIIGGLVVILFAILFGFIISKSITIPVKIAVNAAKKLSEGDLTFHIDQDKIAKNEIGVLLEALQTTTNNLKQIVVNISQASTSLGDSSNQLNNVTSNTAEGIREQLQMTDQVAVAMNEMTATVQEVAQNAGTAAELTSKANMETDTGIQVITGTIAIITKLEDEIVNTATRLTELSKEADNIGGILDVIRGIADQTNLLALNAAIEAARAGEQGRGFSVVADEVRSLAQRTQESTAEIQNLIERLQRGTNEAVTTMEKSREFVTSSVNEASKSGASLNSISNVIVQINDMNTQIASASEEQSVTAEQINQNVVAVNEISQQSTKDAESTVQSSIELSKLADKLNGTVSRFKV